MNRGCVPSKALLAASGRVRDLKNDMHLRSLGIQVCVALQSQHQTSSLKLYQRWVTHTGLFNGPYNTTSKMYQQGPMHVAIKDQTSHADLKSVLRNHYNFLPEIHPFQDLRYLH